jgi:hypothetical protein
LFYCRLQFCYIVEEDAKKTALRGTPRNIWRILFEMEKKSLSLLWRIAYFKVCVEENQ